MRGFRLSKPNRIRAGVMAFMVLFVVLFSSFFIAKEAGHKCSHCHDCPICTCIQQCEQALHTIGTGLVSALSVILPILFVFLSVFICVRRFSQDTLVSYKVRMNN